MNALTAALKEELNVEMPLAAMGKKSAKWYDHSICVSNPVEQ